jgi:hypothetical protein
MEPISTQAASAAFKVGKEVTSPVSKSIGQTLSDVWYSNYGYKWSEKRQKKEIEVAHNIEKFKEDIKSKANKIPDENRQEPDIDIVGSALDAAKFRTNKQEIRGMFASLIAAAMDSSKSDDIHPSFSEMIKMLSPLDAKNLHYLYTTSDETISKIRITYDKGFTDVYNNIYLGNPEVNDNQLIAPSIDNLARLKLVDVTYDTFKINDALYDKHRNNPLFLEYKQKQEKRRKNLLDTLNFLKSGGKIVDSNSPDPLPEEIQSVMKKLLEEGLESSTIDIVKGTISLTDLGRNFCKVCLSE